MDEFLKQLIENSIEIPKERRNKILQMMEWNIRKSIRTCKHDIMTVLIEEANKNSTIYEAVVLINQIYENEDEEKTNRSLGTER